ncbi:unnamed protein product [Prorocentrum cordatum]|uniref:Uncharacterized protein n=1 Tax=Prorocentrum cordatum TaxID=2364126 RepID=A0ABN9Q7W7_9DINO|nr:unnamed protein product [Polarella glacialis]
MRRGGAAQARRPRGRGALRRVAPEGQARALAAQRAGAEGVEAQAGHRLDVDSDSNTHTSERCQEGGGRGGGRRAEEGGRSEGPGASRIQGLGEAPSQSEGAPCIENNKS